MASPLTLSDGFPVSVSRTLSHGHRAQLGGPALGDAPVCIAVARLEGAADEAAVARRLLGAREAADLGEDRDRGEGDDRPHPRHGLESLHDLAPLLRFHT